MNTMTIRRRRVWPWLLAAALLLLLVLVAAGGATTLLLLADAARDGLHVVVNDEPWEPVWDIDANRGAALAGVTLALLALIVVVPLVVTVGLLAAALGIGAALLALALVAAVVLSPLWLLALLLWLALRPRRPQPAASMQP